MDAHADVSELPAGPDDAGEVYAPGDSALEVAARRGFGPLSPQGRRVWHGEATPCVSCGQLVPNGTLECPDCGQDLHPEMVERMRAHAGPWYVHEHVRPFPGVTLERLVRQIRRGVLTATTIVRGPTTDHQWRFAAQTPGLSKYLGLCWTCHAPVQEADANCRQCGVELNGGYRLRPTHPPEPTVPAPPSQRRAKRDARRRAATAPDWPGALVAPPAPAAVESSELQALSAAIPPGVRAPLRPSATSGARVAGIPAWCLIAALLLVLFVAMGVIIRQRRTLTAHWPVSSEGPIPALPIPQTGAARPGAPAPAEPTAVPLPTSAPVDAPDSGAPPQPAPDSP